MTVPSFDFGLASGPLSVTASESVALGKALPIGRDLELDPDTGDLLLSSGDLTLVRDVPAIRQEAELRMKFFLGEWFLDTTAGLPYFQNILVKAPNLNAIKSVLSDEIAAVVGVKSLTSLNLNYDRVARTLSVTWSATTDVGELIQSTVDLAQG